MGYTTEFYGHVEVVPPLNQDEVEYLNRFSATRRMKRKSGPYTADLGSDGFGQDHSADVIDYNSPAAGQPGLWCQWQASDDGTRIGWDGGEKFYDSAHWMQYVIDHFLKPNGEASRSGDEQFASFTFDHVVNGAIEAQGEEHGDQWMLVVEDNVVKVSTATTTFSAPRPL